MNPEFWQKRWQENQIGWHNSKAHPLLAKHFQTLSLKKGNRIFIPLCGKTLDIRWLLSQGYKVAGAELSELAVEQLFTELGIAPNIVKQGNLKHYSAESIDIFVGDIFDLSPTVLGNIDAVYDRAALVALPTEIRDRYSMHLRNIVNKAPHLLLTFEYDQTTMDGPPFSIGHDEVNRQYLDTYKIDHLESIEVLVRDEAKGKEHVWLLSKTAL